MEKQERVLFVVYRVEWWGCFDSLCRQECDNDSVECYVLPIPRYGKDMLTGQIKYTARYYDSGVLQKEIPGNAIMLDCETFSLEQKFDRVYIHNPYDNDGPVDTVDEKYYSWNLKQCARKLIYVPHCLYIGSIPDDMVRYPIYAQVDVIYLPDVRAKYSLDVAYDTKVEIVPSGIIEYMGKLNARKLVPKTGKKRLLYCVSFYDLFYGTEKQIQKMWDIFKYMETRKDIEFVFRPDEDIRARYRQLPENVILQYEELLDYFRGNELGVLDESLNPYLAAVEADGIMTTNHMMSNLLSVQGKYMLYVDRECRPIPNEEDRCIPSIWACAVEEVEEEIVLWFVPERTRLLCRMSIPGGNVEGVSEVPDEGIMWNNYIDIVKVGECLYLAPFLSNGIWKYDLAEGKYDKIYLPKSVMPCMSKIISYENNLYFIPYNYPAIIKYEITDGKIVVLDEWIAQLEEIIEYDCKDAAYFVWAVSQEENMLYLASAKCDAWLEMNLETDECRVKKMNIPGQRFRDMVKEDSKVWLLSYDGTELIQWDMETKESKLLCKVDKMENVGVAYEFLLDMGNYIAAFPHTEESVLMFSKNLAEPVGKNIGKETNLSEFLKQKKIRYEVVKRLTDGNALVYSYSDGSFRIMGKELQLRGKFPCRLSIQDVRGQSDILLGQLQCRNGFPGMIAEEIDMPSVVDFFVDCEEENRELIRQYYNKVLE